MKQVLDSCIVPLTEQDRSCMTKAACKTLIDAIGKKYQAISPVRAVKMAAAFCIDDSQIVPPTNTGPQDYEGGDYIVELRDGDLVTVYCGMTAAEFERNFCPARKPRQKKVEK